MDLTHDVRHCIARHAALVLLLPLALAVGASGHDWQSDVGKEHCAAVALCGATMLAAVLPTPRDAGARLRWPVTWSLWDRLAGRRLPPARLTGRVALERLVPMLA